MHDDDPLGNFILDHKYYYGLFQDFFGKIHSGVKFHFFSTDAFILKKNLRNQNIYLLTCVFKIVGQLNAVVSAWIMINNMY